MPTPFPGMDPYLEHPAHWQDFHADFIVHARKSLVTQLRPRYAVNIEERAYLASNDDPEEWMYVPDIKLIFERERPLRKAGSNGGAVVCDEPIFALTQLPLEVKERYIEIRDIERRRTITVIELLSPTNKRPHSEGRKSYMDKRNEYMHSKAHMVEIDLLRDGVRVPVSYQLPPCDYLVHVSRANLRPRGMLWAASLLKPLPIIPIPLKKDDENAHLDLNALVNEVYDSAGYDYKIDYKQEPVPPLPPHYQAWSKKIRKSVKTPNGM